MIYVTVDQFTNSEVKDPGLLNLIARLTGLLLQVEVSVLYLPKIMLSSWYLYIQCVLTIPEFIREW